MNAFLDETHVVQPDLVFVSAAHAGLMERRGILGAPDLVVEIISPASLRRDRYNKRELQSRFGVQEFWLADVANHPSRCSRSREAFTSCSPAPQGWARSARPSCPDSNSTWPR